MNQPMEQHKSKVSLIIVIIVILVVLAFVIFYLRDSDLGSLPGLSNQMNDVQKLEQQGTSDEVATIEQDLAATNLNNLDKELDSIDKELSTPVTQ